MFIIGCSPTKQFESQFKYTIKKNFPNCNVCFRIDRSNKVNLYVLTGFRKGEEYEFNENDSLRSDFESGNNCDLIALSGKIGDSVLLAAIYPNKKGIKYEINEFSTRFETGKYFLCSHNKSILCDSLTYYHSLPFVPPIAPELLNKIRNDQEDLNNKFDSIILSTPKEF